MLQLLDVLYVQSALQVVEVVVAAISGVFLDSVHAAVRGAAQADGAVRGSDPRDGFAVLVRRRVLVVGALLLEEALLGLLERLEVGLAYEAELLGVDQQFLVVYVGSCR